MATKFKFRGFSEELKNWIYGAPVSDTVLYLNNTEYNVSIIQLFSGYYDKSNTEIFEGDILKYGDNDLYKQIGIVKFLKGKFVISGPFGIYNISDKWIKNPQIIGNITEHKSLTDKLYSLMDEFEMIKL